MVQLFRVGALQLAFDRSVLAARLLCLLHDLKEQPALLGRPESTGLGKAIVAKRTVEGLRRDRATMVYTSQINADLHVRFVFAATIACCHELILSTAGAKEAETKYGTNNPSCSTSSGKALASFRRQ